MEKTLPDYIVDELVARIYVGQYPPGFRLPAERGFAEELKVDRTSLRMALRTLNRMKVVQSVRGSGITVMDFRQHAGLDFLGVLFDIPELELGSQLKLEGVESFLSMIPGMLSASLRGPIDAAVVMAVRDILQRQLQTLDEGHQQGELDIKKLIKYEMDLQETLMLYRSTTLGSLMMNSTRAIRYITISENFELIDIREHVMAHQEMLIQVASGNFSPEEFATHYYQFLDGFTRPLREKYAKHPLQPCLIASPLDRAREQLRGTH